MINQKINFNSSISFSTLKSHLSAATSLYCFTLGSSILGFATYLFLETFSVSNSKLTSWSGESLFWGIVLLLASLFIVFIPVEFLKSFKITNNSYNDLILNIFSIIIISLIFLISFQILIPSGSLILNEISVITRSISFSGFIVLPISFFILSNIGRKISAIQEYNFSIVLLIWIFSLQTFL